VVCLEVLPNFLAELNLILYRTKQMAMANVDKGELMDQVKQQIAVANAQELLTQMTQKCFKKCVNKPGTSLDSSEQVEHSLMCAIAFI